MKKLFVLAVLVVSACTDPVRPVAGPEAVYNVVVRRSTTGIPIQVLGGLDGCLPADINYGGLVAGTCGSYPDWRVFLWGPDRGRVDLDVVGQAKQMNDRGEIVGDLVGSPTIHGFVWSPVHGLVILPGRAWTINDRGLVAGFVEGPLDFVPFKWSRDGGFQRLSSCIGELPCYYYEHPAPMAANNAGRILGLFGFLGGMRIALWLPFDGTIDLTERGAPSAVYMELFGLNDANEILGRISDPATDSSWVYVWSSKGGMRIIAPGTHRRWAGGLNNAGAVAGWYQRGESALEVSPFVSTRTETIDLGTLGGPNGVARAINDRGQIVGAAQGPDGRTRVVIWRVDAAGF